jgi:group I intron endonuclease
MIESGIYKLTNKETGRVYVGATKNLESRWDSHFNALIRQDHANYLLQQDCMKYGLYVFKFEVIEQCKVEDLKEREQFWIDHYGGIESDKTYNLLDSRTALPEVVEKRRKGMIGKKRSQEFKERRKEQMLGNKLMAGKIHSDETKQKIGEANSVALKGHKQSEDTKNKRAEALKKYWADVKAGRVKR